MALPSLWERANVAPPGTAQMRQPASEDPVTTVGSSSDEFIAAPSYERSDQRQRGRCHFSQKIEQGIHQHRR